jgi:hypothetical protein
MSKIKDVQTAKVGLSGLFGSPTPTTTPEVSIEETPLSSKEEVEETLGEETLEALRKEVQRRKHLTSGRPPGSTKGTPHKNPDTIPMTFRITPEKQERLRDYALRRGLLIREVIERGIDLVLKEEEV